MVHDAVEIWHPRLKLASPVLQRRQRRHHQERSGNSIVPEQVSRESSHLHRLTKALCSNRLSPHIRQSVSNNHYHLVCQNRVPVLHPIEREPLDALYLVVAQGAFGGKVEVRKVNGDALVVPAGARRRRYFASTLPFGELLPAATGHLWLSRLNETEILLNGR